MQAYFAEINAHNYAAAYQLSEKVRRTVLYGFCRRIRRYSMKAANGDTAAYQYATIYAQWGNRAKALESLETALRVRDPGLRELKTDPLLDPLRKEPRFREIERGLKFPT